MMSDLTRKQIIDCQDTDQVSKWCAERVGEEGYIQAQYIYNPSFKTFIRNQLEMVPKPYATDLNAAAELVEGLDRSEHDYGTDYLYNLIELTFDRDSNGWFDTVCVDAHLTDLFNTINASAMDRCKAWLLTKIEAK